MKASLAIIDGLGSIPAFARGASLAIGNFDGVHRGHQALIALAIERARATSRSAGVMIFEPHPREFFKPQEPHFRLTTLEQKLAIFDALGLDFAIVIRFDDAFASLSAKEFIDRILISTLAVSHAVIGYDFFFGKNRAGTPDMLWQAGETHGFAVSVIAPVAEAGEVFSSSTIRLHLAQGDVAGAARALGRWWRVEGRVVPGARRGRDIGFPTANVPMTKGTALAHGIYAVRAYIDGRSYDAAAYLGTRPTFDDGMPVLEVFIFDFADDIYGREIAVEFIAFIRGDRKFAGVDALKAQMSEDCNAARAVLSATPAQYT